MKFSNGLEPYEYGCDEDDQPCPYWFIDKKGTIWNYKFLEDCRLERAREMNPDDSFTVLQAVNDNRSRQMNPRDVV